MQNKQTEEDRREGTLLWVEIISDLLIIFFRTHMLTGYKSINKQLTLCKDLPIQAILSLKKNLEPKKTERN